MRFLLTCLWVWLILHLPPTHHHDPSMTTVTGESPDTIGFASHALLDSYGVVVVDWKRSNRLRLKTQDIYRVHPRRLYRVHRPAAVIVTAAGCWGRVCINLQADLFGVASSFCKDVYKPPEGQTKGQDRQL